MLEEFVHGQEVQVAIVAGKAIGAIEIIPKLKKFYDYETKYTNNMAEHICPANVPDEIYKRALDDTLKVYKLLKCRGIARADFIYDKQNKRLIMLELNTHPGFTNQSLVPEIAQKCAGISFDQLVDIIVNDLEKN
jgi:D-alanine-D-alanine ligase